MGKDMAWHAGPLCKRSVVGARQRNHGQHIDIKTIRKVAALLSHIASCTLVHPCAPPRTTAQPPITAAKSRARLPMALESKGMWGMSANSWDGLRFATCKGAV